MRCTTLTFRLLFAVFLSALLLQSHATARLIHADSSNNRIFLPVTMNPENAGAAITLPTGATIIHVSTRGQDAGACGSASTPCRTIQRGVDLALASSTTDNFIKVAQGTYTGGDKAVVAILMPSDRSKTITLMGGFSEQNWSRSVVDPANTVIDGQGARRGIVIRDTRDKLITVQGITVRNALLTDNVLYTNRPDSYFGAGLSCGNSRVMLSNMVFYNNIVRRGQGKETTGGGGAALYHNCPGTLDNIRFEQNQVYGGSATDGSRGGIAQGGGLLASEGSTMVATNLTFLNNHVVAGSGGTGQDSIGWRADALGGGASLQHDNFVLNGVTAIGNTVTAGSGSQYGGFGDGGGLFFENSVSEVRNGFFKDNVAKSGASPTGQGGAGGGGAIMSVNATLMLDRLTMVNNSGIGGDGADGGDAGGGALYFTSTPNTPIPSRVTGTNLVMANNRAEAGQGNNRWGGGGAIFNQDTYLTLSHATIVNNSVLESMFAPAIVALSSHTPSTVNLSYSVVADHSHSIPTSVVANAVAAISRNDVVNLDHVLFFGNVGNYAAENGAVVHNRNPVPSGDPLFASPGAPNYDYHIRANSAARDRASGSILEIDVDGDNRKASGIPDIGADEYMQ